MSWVRSLVIHLDVIKISITSYMFLMISFLPFVTLMKFTRTKMNLEKKKKYLVFSRVSIPMNTSINVSPSIERIQNKQEKHGSDTTVKTVTSRINKIKTDRTKTVTKTRSYGARSTPSTPEPGLRRTVGAPTSHTAGVPTTPDPG